MPDTSTKPYSTPYIGRFAPSPTGPLHMGSLVAALASYMEARVNNGKWLLRIEDIDPPRESREAAYSILKTLEALHLEWDGDVLYQSTRLHAYQEALELLLKLDCLFPCQCTRRKIQQEGGLHQGKCQTNPETHQPVALRCLVKDEDIEFDDIFQGPQKQNLAREAGDFIIKRKEGLFAYQLAVVVDDAFQQVSHVIRGIDLLDSTCRQIYLQDLLELSSPLYGHIPVLVNQAGQKLSKQHHARAVDDSKPSTALFIALQHLQQEPDRALLDCSVEEVLNWGIKHWNRSRVENIRHIICQN